MKQTHLRWLAVPLLSLLPCFLMGCGGGDTVPADQLEQHESDAAAAATDDPTVP